MKEIRLQAHRGVSTDCPENTIPAFQASVDQGYKIIELDAKYTKDNVCVILHDRSINRTGRTPEGVKFEEEMKIVDLDFDFVRSLDFGLWMGEEFRGTQIPTLDEALEFLRNNEISSKFDNVWQSYTPEQQNDFITRLINAGLGKKLGITFSKLDHLRNFIPIIPNSTEIHWDGALDEATLKEVAELVTKNRRLTVWTCCKNEYTKWFKGEEASEEVVARIKAIGAEIGVWILHHEEELDKAINVCQADAIETTGGIKVHMLEKFN